jgi:hypothetical protein
MPYGILLFCNSHTLFKLLLFFLLAFYTVVDIRLACVLAAPKRMVRRVMFEEASTTLLLVG